MLNPWLPSQKLNWNSDWDGEDVGYEGVDVVGLYTIANTSIDVYIDMSTMQILEIICYEDHEEE